MTFLWKRVTREGALWGLVTGGGIALVLDLVVRLGFVSAETTLGIHPGIYGVVGNVIVMVLVSLRTPPMPAEHVAQFSDA